MQSSSAVMERLMKPVVEASTVMRVARSSVARLASSMAGTISSMPGETRAGGSMGEHCTWILTGLDTFQGEYCSESQI